MLRASHFPALLLALPAAIGHAAPSQATPQAEASLSQRLKAERPEVDRLLEALQPAEALAKAEALLPATAPTWDNTDGNSQYRSWTLLPDYASAYYLASRAAVAAGQWEKALEHLKKAQAILKDNAAQAEAAFPKIANAYMQRAQMAQDALDARAGYTANIRARNNPNEEEKAHLAKVVEHEKVRAENEKWAKNFLGFAEMAKKDATRFDASVKTLEDRLKAEETQIAEYKAGKGEKSKWVDAIVSTPDYLSTSFPEKRARFEFLCRLAVLDPSNVKVSDAKDIELGKTPPPRPKATPKPKAKPKKG